VTTDTMGFECMAVGQLDVVHWCVMEFGEAMPLMHHMQTGTGVEDVPTRHSHGRDQHSSNYGADHDLACHICEVLANVGTEAGLIGSWSSSSNVCRSCSLSLIFLLPWCLAFFCTTRCKSQQHLQLVQSPSWLIPDSLICCYLYVWFLTLYLLYILSRHVFLYLFLTLYLYDALSLLSKLNQVDSATGDIFINLTTSGLGKGT
jgi:hypothetical protein